MPPEGRIDAPLGKDPARRASGASTRAAIPPRPATGRSATGPGSARSSRRARRPGAPTRSACTSRTSARRSLGDARYGGPRRVGEVAIPRVMLHARRLELAHPATGAPIAFEAPVPEDFAAAESGAAP